jgi:hypothetical protein
MIATDTTTRLRPRSKGRGGFESATDGYAGHNGGGTITGDADLTLPRPRGNVRYAGHLVAEGENPTSHVEWRGGPPSGVASLFTARIRGGLVRLPEILWRERSAFPRAPGRSGHRHHT